MDTKLALVTNAHSLDLVTQEVTACTWLHPNRTRPSPGPLQRLNKPLHRLSIQHVHALPHTGAIHTLEAYYNRLL